MRRVFKQDPKVKSAEQTSRREFQNLCWWWKWHACWKLSLFGYLLHVYLPIEKPLIFDQLCSLDVHPQVPSLLPRQSAQRGLELFHTLQALQSIRLGFQRTQGTVVRHGNVVVIHVITTHITHDTVTLLRIFLPQTPRKQYQLSVPRQRANNPINNPTSQKPNQPELPNKPVTCPINHKFTTNC